MSAFNVWNKWGKLNAVMLGDTYKKEFYTKIKNKKIRDALYKIADEAQEDLAHYEAVLKDFGADVIRPYMNDSDCIMNYVDDSGMLMQRKGIIMGGAGVPSAPLQPRDAHIVIGNTMYYTGFDGQGICDSIEDWAGSTDNIEKVYSNDIPQFSAPAMTHIGQDLYIDNIDDDGAKLDDSFAEKIMKNSPNLRINKLTIGGHNDGCFHPLKPGALLSLRDIQNYEHTFPGWEVCYLDPGNESNVDAFLAHKERVGGKWWVPGEEDNSEFTDFVESWLGNWVGYVEESVFDVNVLMLDDRHCCVTNMKNEKVNTFLKKHGITPVHVPWRHRYFYDGGLHCITLDLHRDGTMEDYFPDRNSSVSDKGFF